MSAVNQDRGAEDLSDFAATLTRQLFPGILAVQHGVLAESYLYQLVELQRIVEGRDHSLADSLFSYLNDGRQTVSDSAKVPPLFARERHEARE